MDTRMVKTPIAGAAATFLGAATYFAVVGYLSASWDPVGIVGLLLATVSSVASTILLWRRDLPQKERIGYTIGAALFLVGVGLVSNHVDMGLAGLWILAVGLGLAAMIVAALRMVEKTPRDA